MKIKPLTIQQLEATWWWRQPEHKDESERIETMGYLLAARNYELMRFAPEAKNYQTNFLKLDRENRTIAAMAWGKLVETPCKHNYDPWKIETGWTNTRPPLQWNLRLSKRQLKKAFLDYIDQELKLQNLSPVTKLTGKKNRPATWGYVEFLGRRRNQIGNMEDGQRGMASKAEAMAIQCLAEFKAAEAKGMKKGNEWAISVGFEDGDDSIG